MTDGPAFDAEAIRRDFPILEKPLPKDRRLVYLDSGSSAQKPQAVIDAERECYESYYANAYRGAYYFGVRVDEELERARESVRTFLGASAKEEIAFTSGTTMALNIVAGGWARKHLRPGDEVLINEMEHHANFVPWQQACAATGATLRFIPVTDDGRLDMEALDNVLTEKTRLVSVTGMSNVLGTINPVAELARRARDVGAVTVVDGAQSVPHLPTNVQDLGIDFLAFSGHKLYGPSGIGILWGRREILDETDPFVFGGHMIDQVHKDHSTYAAPPSRFEAGTLPIAQAIALEAAVDYVSGIGFEAIEAHERELVDYGMQRLAEVPGLQLLGPAAEERGAIFSFVMEGAHPQDVSHVLNRQGIAVRHGHHCTMPLHERFGIPASTRASFGIYNTCAEVDLLVEGLLFARKRLRLD